MTTGNRGTAAVAWLALIVSLITFIAFVLASNSESRESTYQLKRIADVLEGIYGSKSSQK